MKLSNWLFLFITLSFVFITGVLPVIVLTPSVENTCKMFGYDEAILQIDGIYCKQTFFGMTKTKSYSELLEIHKNIYRN